MFNGIFFLWSILVAFHKYSYTIMGDIYWNYPLKYLEKTKQKQCWEHMLMPCWKTIVVCSRTVSKGRIYLSNVSNMRSCQWNPHSSYSQQQITDPRSGLASPRRSSHEARRRRCRKPSATYHNLRWSLNFHNLLPTIANPLLTLIIVALLFYDLTHFQINVFRVLLQLSSHVLCLVKCGSETSSVAESFRRPWVM